MKYPAITNENMITKSQFDSVIMSTVLTKTEIEYAKKLFELSSLDQSREISFIYSLDEKIKTESGARRRLSSLFKKGLLEKRFKKTGKAQRPVTIYYFSILNIAKKSLEIENSHLKVNSLETSNKFSTPFNSDIDIDLLFTLIFPSLNLSDNFTEISSSSKWENSNILIQSSITNDSEIEFVANVMDLQCYISIIRLASHRETQSRIHNKDSDNQFYIDIEIISETLCDQFTKEMVVDSIRRLSATTFKVSNLPAILIKQYKLTSGVQHINLISNMGMYEIESKETGDRMPGVLLSLPEFIYRGIKFSNKINEIYNPLVIKNENPLMFMLHSYCRKNLSFAMGRIHHTTLPELKKTLSPKSSMEDFKDLLFNGLRKEYDIKVNSGEKVENKQNAMLKPITYSNGEIIVFRCDIYGYLINIEGQSISIITNTSDKYVGAISTKNKEKKKKRKLLITPQMKLNL